MCLLHPPNLQPQLLNQRLNLTGNLRRDVVLDFQEGAAMAPAVFSHRALSRPQQPVGNIDVIQEVLRRGLLLQNISDGHVEAWYVMEAFGPFGKPSTSGNAVIFQEPRTAIFSALSCDLPPEASQRYCGISPVQISAVFSLSTRATGFPGLRRRRCSQKSHCVTSQSCGSIPVRFIRE